MFDVVSGLPVHALVVHAVVVLLPLMALLTIAVGFQQTWRERAAWWVVGANAVILGLVFVARRSGQNLQTRLSELTPGIAAEHAKQGRLLLWFAVALLVAALVMALLARRGSGASTGAAVLVAVVSLAAIAWTVRTGDSGARQVWESVIKNTKAP